MTKLCILPINTFPTYNMDQLDIKMEYLTGHVFVACVDRTCLKYIIQILTAYECDGKNIPSWIEGLIVPFHEPIGE